MALDQFLSQDEVDALLEGVTGESQSVAEPVSDPSGVRDYDPLKPRTHRSWTDANPGDRA